MKKLFVSVVSFVSALFIFTASGYCDNEKILVRVGDIKPVKNAAGEVQSCDFEVMVFNRSAADMKSASIAVTWMDETIAAVVRNEIAESTDSKNKTKDADKITMLLDLPEIKSYKQVALRTSLKTDRCFLLLSNASIDVKRCSAVAVRNEAETTTKAGAVRTSLNVNMSCAPFEFIYSKDPQYYKEFKKLSPEEQKELEKSQSERDREENSRIFNDIMNSFEETRSVINSIGTQQ